MSEKKEFSLDLGNLKARDKPGTADVVRRADEAGKPLGFVPRGAQGRSRPASPRTGQFHARVLPEVAAAIADEAKRRGVQQGVILEEAWALYCEANGLPD